MNSNIVKLCVGGTVFMTTRSTLTQHNSFLSQLINSTIGVALDNDGNIFIDRNGDLFKYILEFLRSGYVPNFTDITALKQLTKEADFYQITPLTTILNEEIKLFMRKRGFAINVGGRIYKTDIIKNLSKKFKTPRYICPGSYLYNLYKFVDECVMTNEIKFDEHDNIFVDRNQKLFIYVLDYLQEGSTNGLYSLSGKKVSRLRSILLEMIFYFGEEAWIIKHVKDVIAMSL